MSEQIAAATDELKKLFNVLAQDVEEARAYGQKNPTPFAHRSLFRAAFALIEGLSFKLRMVSLACAEAQPELLSPAEISLLKDERYKLNNKGLPEALADFQKLLPSILFSMRCYAKVHGTLFEPELGENGYGAFKHFITLRNSIEHPKSLVDLKISDEQLRHVTGGMKWWKSEVLRLLETCREADEYWKGRLA